MRAPPRCAVRRSSGCTGDGPNRSGSRAKESRFMCGFSTMSGMADLTVDEFAAEADALDVVSIALESIEEGDVRDPHRHAYHELIWVREGSGQHLIDGEPVVFGPRTLTLIAKGQVHQFERADRISGVVVRFDDEWLAGSRRWLFSGGACTALSVPEGEAARFDALLDLVREEGERPA